jgi:hypothetical protein
MMLTWEQSMSSREFQQKHCGSQTSMIDRERTTALLRPRLRTMMLAVAGCAVALVVLPILGRVLSLDCADDAYALWGAGDMVVKYMEDHGGRWPKGWGDLKP